MQPELSFPTSYALPQRSATRRVSRWAHGSVPLASVVVLLGAWWAVTAQPWFGPRAVLSSFTPQATFPVFVQLLSQGVLIEQGWISIRRVLLALALASIVGVTLGLALGSSRLAERTVAPALHVVRTVSPLSWMPLVIMLLGIGDLAVIFLIAIAAVWPVLFSTLGGLHQLDREWVMMARSVGAKRHQILFHVAIPAVLPQIVNGMRVAVGLAWVVLVPAEMLGVTNGLGYWLLNTRDRLAYSELMAVILAIGLIGLALDTAIRALAFLLPGARR